MTFIARLLSSSNRKQELKLITQNLIQLYKENERHPSRPVIMFVISLFATFGVGAGYILNKLISDFRDRRDSRPLYRRSSSTILKNGDRELFIPYKGRQKRVNIQPTDPELYEKDKFKFKNFVKNIRNEHESDKVFSSKFLNQLMIIWQILIPKFTDKNTALLITQVFFLISRTWLSLLIAKLDGQIVKDIIGGKFRKFLRDLVYWFLMAVPASYTNSTIKYLQKKLSISFRTNLMRYVHDMYLDPRMVYYKVSFSNQAVRDIDNFITTDITRFSNAICSLVSNLGKPMMDLVFFAFYLRDNLGTAGITGIFINYFITASVLKRFTPPFGRLTREKSELEGEYYNDHLNLINNSEEIAFYDGSELEKVKINSVYERMMDHIFKINHIKVKYNFLEDYILKYTWSALGYLYASIPIFIVSLNNDIKKATEERNMRQFIVNKRLMLSMADAGSRLMYSIKDISKLTGLTDRVFTLLTVLHQVHAQEFNYGDENSYNTIKGTIQYHFNGLRFEKIDVIVPSSEGDEGVKLINQLDFNLKNHESILILGANGCGKTSIERIMAGLWPLYHGLLSRPNDDDIIYLPQRPYFSNASLREQIIYPMSHQEMVSMGHSDEDLVNILKEVKLEYLLDRDVGLNYLNSVHEWKDVLSGGEKQRVQFARILFKNPKFVVLDESTNAISSDIEAYLFDMLKKKGFAFITLSHRPLLIKYHDYLLEILDNGNWVLETLGTDSAITSIDKEIKEIKDKLQVVDRLEQRKLKLESLLDGDEPLDDEVVEVEKEEPKQSDTKQVDSTPAAVPKLLKSKKVSPKIPAVKARKNEKKPAAAIRANGNTNPIDKTDSTKK